MSEKELLDIYADIDETKKTIKVREEGDKGEGLITDIKIGYVKDFVPEDSLRHWRGSVESQCMQLWIETPDKQVMKQVITFSSHPNSNLQRWFRRYGKYPEVNDKVKLRHDGNFWQTN